MTILGDSEEYDLLKEMVKSSYNLVPYKYILTCEIGVREGLGSKVMIEEIRNKYQGTYLHVGIDPYGNLSYSHYDKGKTVKQDHTADYTNNMKEQLKKDFLDYPQFQLMNLTDTEFMKRYADGIPVYNQKTILCEEYTCVHFDGPHQTEDILKQFMFFSQRVHRGSTFCFDDYLTYDMDLIQSVAKVLGFVPIKKGDQKYIMRKEYVN